jgi:hypothetical protein
VAVCCNPDKSDRAIAEEIGVSDQTVGRVREKAAATDVAVGKRVGEGAFTKRKGKPVKQHSTFHVTYDDNELTRIRTALVDLVDPLISLPRTTGVRGNAMHAYMRDLLVYHSMDVIRCVMFFKHEAYRNEKEYRFQQLFRRDKPAPVKSAISPGERTPFAREMLLRRCSRSTQRAHLRTTE